MMRREQQKCSQNVPVKNFQLICELQVKSIDVIDMHGSLVRVARIGVCKSRTEVIPSPRTLDLRQPLPLATIKQKVNEYTGQQVHNI